MSIYTFFFLIVEVFKRSGLTELPQPGADFTTSRPAKQKCISAHFHLQINRKYQCARATYFCIISGWATILRMFTVSVF